MSVHEFKPIKERRAFQCMQCDRQDFWLLEDGGVECRGCGLINASLRHYDKREHHLVKNEQ